MKKLTVAEYQKTAGVSKKTIYKRIEKGQLKTTTEKVNNRDITFIIELEDGEEDFTILTPSLPSSPDISPQFEGNNPPSSPQFEGNNPPSSPDFTPSFFELLQKQLEEKDRQLAEKDRQLLEKDKQIEREQERNREKDITIKEQLDKMNELLRNSQLLQAQVNHLLNAGTGEEPLKENTVIEESPAHNKKKSWFSRWLFGE